MSNRELVPFYDTATDPVVFRDKASQALHECISLLATPDATLADARGVNDLAARIEQFAKIAEDDELHTKAAEAKLRAGLKIGVLSLKLDKATHGPGRGNKSLPNDGKPFKAKVLAEAGISTSTAHRYEQVAGGPDEKRQRKHEAVANDYFAACREKQEPATFAGLELAIRSALPVRTPRYSKGKQQTHNTFYEREPTTIRLPTTNLESKPFPAPWYRVPSTYEEGVEAAATLLDDAAKEQTSPEARALVEHLAKRVREELVPPRATLGSAKAH